MLFFSKKYYIVHPESTLEPDLMTDKDYDHKNTAVNMADIMSNDAAVRFGGLPEDYHYEVLTGLEIKQRWNNIDLIYGPAVSDKEWREWR